MTWQLLEMQPEGRVTRDCSRQNLGDSQTWRLSTRRWCYPEAKFRSASWLLSQLQFAGQIWRSRHPSRDLCQQNIHPSDRFNRNNNDNNKYNNNNHHHHTLQNIVCIVFFKLLNFSFFLVCMLSYYIDEFMIYIIIANTILQRLLLLTAIFAFFPINSAIYAFSCFWLDYCKNNEVPLFH